MNGSRLQQRTNELRKKVSLVALQPKTVSEITIIEDDLAEVVSELRKLRIKMTESGLETVELETEKAEGFVKYLKEDWVGKMAARVRKADIQRQAELVKKRAAEQRKASK